MFSKLRSLFLLGTLCLSSIISFTFLYESLLGHEAPILVPNAQSSSDMVEKLKGLDAGERATRLTFQIEYLVSEPLEINAINNISILQAFGDDTKLSESIVVEAAKRSLRDAQSQLSAVNILLKKREFSQALYHLDGLLGSRPKLTDQLFKVLLQLQQDPEGLTSVASVLNGNPSWRSIYLGSLLKNDASGQATFQLLAAIRKAGGSVSDGELRDFIAAQITNENYDIAYFSWLDSLDAEALKSVSFVYDGKFQRTPRSQYFDWTLVKYPNATLEISAKPGAPSDNVLRIDFLGARDAFSHVKQYLRLAPGTYEVSAEWSAETFQSPSGLQWQVYCIGGSSNIPPSKLLNTTRSWNKLAFPVTIPEENCETQLLQLQSASAAALDQRFDGQMYFDNISIQQVPIDQLN